MSKLKLQEIRKSYKAGSEPIEVLKGVSLEFRKSEFVSILGPSGCGKTTLLNIIGGLDRYDRGDLYINELSTKKYKDADWDAYRNSSIGFVFQNYNLIAHQTVLQNIEISLTLSGVSQAERKKRAIEALKSVGLIDQMNKKPNQLSGGQMQRVAIARALVNNPDVILADEPTGALDTHTSVQVMEILKDISLTRLVIMVTHNPELADKYSNRIINILDGEIQSDSNPIKISESQGLTEVAAVVIKAKRIKTAMSMLTAASLSFKNLLTKKGRTITTSFAGSIGIIGVALVLALSNGLTGYMNKMQADTLSGFPVTISEMTQSIPTAPPTNYNKGKFPTENSIYSYDKNENTTVHKNQLIQEYYDYLSKIQTKLPNAVNAVSYSRGVDMNILAKGENSVVKFATTASQGGGFGGMMGGGSSLYWQEMPENNDFILSMYDLIGKGSRLPSKKNEIAIVVDEYNRVDKAFFEKLGMFSDSSKYKLTDFIGKKILKVIPNDAFYTNTNNGIFMPATATDYTKLFEHAKGLKLTITGILRVKKTNSSPVGYLTSGLVYTTALTEYVLDNSQKSEIAAAQMKSNNDVILNTPFSDKAGKEQRLLYLGADAKPTSISIYPKNLEGKDAIKKYLDDYNVGKNKAKQIVYSDMTESIGSTVGTILNMVSLVLIAFAAISLFVSTIMISIITYVSVIERTKEIGILRSVGARKKDISRVFNAEALIIGFVAGMLGVGLTYTLSIPVNAIIYNITGISGIADLRVLHALLLVICSMTLTLIAGFVPSRIAAKKDPVVALRTE